MKALTKVLLPGVLLVFLVPSLCVGQTVDNDSVTNFSDQDNDAVNAPTSIMSNTQVNGGVTRDHFGGGVACSRATLQIGTTYTDNESVEAGTVYAAVNIPLGDGSDCKNAASRHGAYVHERTMELKHEIVRKDERHAKDMRKMDLMYKDLLLSVCKNWHPQVGIAEKDPLFAKCSIATPLREQHGHEGPDDHFKSGQFERVMGH